MLSPSVRGLLAVLFLFALHSFRFESSALQGSWQCASKSGKLDELTEYTFRCGGDVTFSPDHFTASTCTDAFIPSGTQWELKADQLILKDSEGTPFMNFTIQQLDETNLVVVRKDVAYAFKRK